MYTIIKKINMNRTLLLLSILFLSFQGKAQDFNLSNGIYFDGEPYLSIDPHNPQHLVVAWIGFTPGYQTGIKVKVSFDGGRSWGASTFLPHISSLLHSADPSLQWDTAGYLYACYIDFNQLLDSGAVCVSRSPDGGLSWGSPHKVINGHADGTKTPIDRPWFCINPLNNHFYITTKPAPWIPIPCRPYYSVSTDTGAHWSWRYLDTTAFLVGSLIQAPMAAPAIGSDGIFHAIYPTYVASQHLLPGFLMASSTSDGAHFSYDSVGYTMTPANDTLAKSGYNLAVDPTNASHLAFNFLLRTFGDLDVFCTETRNGGQSWSIPQRVNDDPVGNGKMQDLTWCGFDRNGDLVAGWRDRRNAPGPGYQQPAEIWGAVKRSDSANWSPNFKISDTLAPFNATYLDTSGNDFMCIALNKDTLYSVWGDVRTGALNIWFVRRNMGETATNDIRLLSDEAIAPVYAYPNPARGKVTFGGGNVSSIKLMDLSGKVLLEQKVKNNQLAPGTLPPGAYLLQMNTAAGSATQRLIVE